MPTPPESQNDHRLFTLLDLRLFRFTAVLSSAVILIALLGVVFWALSIVINTFYNLIVPLAVAGILALVLFPVVDFLQRKLGIGRLLTITLLFSVFTLLVVGLVLLLVPTVVTQVTAFTEGLPAMLERLQHTLQQKFPGIASMLSARIEGGAFDGLIGSESGNGVGKTMADLIGLLVGLVFVPLYLFFALLSGQNLRSRAKDVLSILGPEKCQQIVYFVDVFTGYVTAFFQGQMVIAAIMGVMFAAGFSLVGLELAIPIGLILGLLNVVPFLGTVIGLVIVLPLSYFQPDGGIGVLVVTLVVFAVVQLIESWVLTPRIMANRSGLPPVLVVISVFFWGIAFGGVAGMILAVPLTAFIVAIWGQIKAALTRSLNTSPS